MGEAGGFDASPAYAAIVAVKAKTDRQRSKDDMP
jgi:hypothetical protein